MSWGSFLYPSRQEDYVTWGWGGLGDGVIYGYEKPGAGYRMPDARTQMLDAGYRVPVDGRRRML